MDEKERIVVLEEAVKHMSKTMDEIKETLRRIEDRQTKHMEELAAIKTKTGAIAFIIAGIISGVISFLTHLSGKKM